MGSKRVGLARMESLIKQLKRELALGNNSAIISDKLGRSESGTTVRTEEAVKGTTGTIAVTKDTDNVVEISQPAGTYLKDLIVTPAGNIVTAGASGDDLDIEVGTSSSGGEIFALTAIMDDGGSAVTWRASVPLHLVCDGQPCEANAFAALYGGPATSEALLVGSAVSYSAAARTLYVNFRANTHDLATAATTIKVTAIFASI